MSEISIKVQGLSFNEINAFHLNNDLNIVQTSVLIAGSCVTWHMLALYLFQKKVNIGSRHGLMVISEQ